MRVTQSPALGVDPACLKLLSKRERQVLGLAAAGLLDKEIAPQLGLSPNTLRTYWTRIRRKTGEVSRAGLSAAYLVADLYSQDRSLTDLEFHEGWLLDLPRGEILASASVSRFLGLRPGQPHTLSELSRRIVQEDLGRFNEALSQITDGVRDYVDVFLRVSGIRVVRTVNLRLRSVRGPDNSVAKVIALRAGQFDSACDGIDDSIKWDWMIYLKAWTYRRLPQWAARIGDAGETIPLDEVMTVMFSAEDESRVRKLIEGIRMDGTEAFSFTAKVRQEFAVEHAGAFVKVLRDPDGMATTLLGRVAPNRDLTVASYLETSAGNA